MSREFTSFDVAAVVRELKASIVHSRVNNIYQFGNKIVLFKLHKPDKPVLRLVLEAGKRLHLSDYVTEKPIVPPAFCMALRKHLRNAWLTGVEQHEFERVVILPFKGQAGVLRLVAEFFGEGNLILVGEDGKILQALVYKKMRDRNVLRGEVFRFAPSASKNPFAVSEQQFSEGLMAFGEVEVVRAIARFLSVGGIYAEEVLFQAGVNKERLCNTLTEDEVESVFGALHSLLERVATGPLEPSAVLDETGGLIDVAPFKLKRYEAGELRLQPYGSLDEALDDFYSRLSVVEQMTSDTEIENMRNEADRLRRVIEEQRKVLQETEREIERYKRTGDSIYAHLGNLQTLIDRFSAARQDKKEWKTVVFEVLSWKKDGSSPWVLFESFDEKNLVINVCVDDLSFGLHLKATLFEDAAAFYERSKRARQRLEGAKAALLDSSKKLEEVEAKLHETELSESGRLTKGMERLAERKVKHKEWFEKFRWFISSDGFLVVAGRDAITNEVLIKKHTHSHDVVFHADIIGAPFVVIKTGGKVPSEQCLREAAEFSVAFSRGWREGFGSADAYWVKPEQLSKGGLSGESVGHGAFVVRGERNWQRGTILKLAIGVTVDGDGALRFVGGPVDAVKSKTSVYVVIAPGDESGKDMLKRVLHFLSRKLPPEMREKVIRASIEEIRDFMPFNRGRIAEI